MKLRNKVFTVWNHLLIWLYLGYVCIWVAAMKLRLVRK